MQRGGIISEGRSFEVVLDRNEWRASEPVLQPDLDQLQLHKEPLVSHWPLCHHRVSTKTNSITWSHSTAHKVPNVLVFPPFLPGEHRLFCKRKLLRGHLHHLACQCESSTSWILWIVHHLPWDMDDHVTIVSCFVTYSSNTVYNHITTQQNMGQISISASKNCNIPCCVERGHGEKFCLGSPLAWLQWITLNVEAYLQNSPSASEKVREA